MITMPLWKRLLILAISLWGIVAAVPNAFYGRVEQHNDAIKAIEAAGGTATEEQNAALGQWPSYLPSALMSLGLDLRGGAHLLAEVETASVYAQRIDGMWPEVRDTLKTVRDQVGNVRRQPSDPGVLKVTLSKPEGMATALDKVKALAQPVVTLTGVGSSDLEVTTEGTDTIVVQLSAAEKSATDGRTMQQSLEIIRRRVDEVGTREPTIQREGADRILIQVPGLGSAQELKDIIGTTAKLTFNEVVGQTANASTPAGPNQAVLPDAEHEGVFYVVNTEAVVTGEDLTNAQPTFDQNGRPAVSFQFNPSGARKFGDYTAANIGKPFAIVLDDKVISAPVIQSHIGGGSGQITGNFTVESSTHLAVLLRAGALPAKMTFLEERTIGPELGQDSVDAGRLAAVVGLIAVSVFMIASYGLFGIFAIVALGINMALIIAVLSTIGATLTLPGIGGIVLTIGMAVDANVLVYERIREELRHAKTPGRAVEIGYERALSAIIDANLTTLITAIILFYMGSGPVKGFAVTLGIGVITSVFSAIYITRFIIEVWLNRTRPKTIVV